jgi:hypothetical protein
VTRKRRPMRDQNNNKTMQILNLQERTVINHSSK